MNILCTICMRKGSKGVPGKNIKKINGIPLMDYTIIQARKSKLFNQIVVSTDCDKIAKNAENLKIKNFFKRPYRLSGDRVGKLEVIKHALYKSESHYKKIFDIVFDLDVTSPLRSVRDIKEAFKTFISDGASNLITVSESRHNPFFNQIMKLETGGVKLVKNINSKNFKRRQDTPKVYDMNASIYIWKRDCLLKSEIFGKKTSIYIMPPERSIDIDSKLDFKIVKFLMKKNQR